jgi:acyl carrier protein
MTIANDIIFLALRNGNINGVGQTPMPDDVNDSFKILNAMIAEWNLERLVQVNREPAPPFPDLTTDVPYWTPFEHVLLTTMAVRLRQIYSLPPVQLDVQLAVAAVAAWSAINLQKTPAPTVAADDGTGFGVIFLALRAAGRVADKQGVLETSQDVTDAHSILNEMLDEWNRERSVKVIPGTLPTVTDLSATLSLSAGQKNAVVLGLAVRLRDWFGAEIPKPLLDRAERALALIQAINLQQNPALTIAADDGTGYGVVFLALRAAGRVNDGQGVAQTSQDVSDAHSILNEMLDEWNRERSVKVIPGTLPTIPNLAAAITLPTGQKNAVVLGLAVRLRDWFGAEIPKPLLDRAERALALIQAINLQQNPAPSVAHDDGTGYGILFLALRAAGRVNDGQGITQGSQDVSDAASLMNEMLDEWRRARTVRVIPGTIPTISNLSFPVSLDPGMRNAIVLNLAVRLRDAFGAEVPKSLLDRAALALELVQAINQQQTPKVWTGAPETVGEALFLALRMAGRINDQQSVSEASKDVSDAFTLLMAMMAQWQRKRWLVWSEQEIALISTGDVSYTIGRRQQFDTARPDKIHAAFVRLMGHGGSSSGGSATLAEQLPFPLGAHSVAGAGGHGNMVDIPLTIIESREDWSQVSIKDLKSMPSAVFYDSSYPVGRLHFWPVPIANDYELHLVLKTTLPGYEGLDDPLNMPPEYTAAIIDNLACRIIVASGGQISRELAGQARASLEVVKMTNAQIPLLGMPAALTHYRGDASSWVGRGLNQAWTTGGGSVLS